MTNEASCEQIRRPAADRWARVVIAAVDCASDPKTVAAWGRGVGVAPGTLRNWCRGAGEQACASLHFSRVLRAILLGNRLSWHPSELLDVVDERTLRKLVGRAGVALDSGGDLLEVFLARQQFVRHPGNVDAVVQRLGRAGEAVDRAEDSRAPTSLDRSRSCD